jgi:tRNA threonylcarbamoyladenosine biosynthesis protein TsaB
MITLAIETSGPEGSVAVARDGACLGERRLSRTGRRHARELVAEIGELLRSLGLAPRDVALVAVSVGPGSFTGLRVGVTCAKTFAYAVGCGVAAVDTFEAIAANSPPDVERVEVVGDAQRGDVCVARYRRQAAGSWERKGAIALMPAEAWREPLAADSVVSGPAAARYAADLAGRCRLLPAECHTPRAAAVAQIGERHAREGRLADLWGLEPVYIRPSGAEEKLQRRAPADERIAGSPD